MTKGVNEMEITEEIIEEALNLDNQLCFPLYAAARQVVSLYTPYLKPLGLTYTQYIVFLSLWEKDGVTVGELGSKLHLDNGTLTPLLKKLQAQGYIERNRAADDERVVLITLTDKGRALREEVKEIPFKVAACFSFPVEDSLKLRELLCKLIENTEDRQ